MVNSLKEYIVNQKTTGAIWPSSSSLAKAMANQKTLSISRSVVELGPGSGAITKQILARKPQNCTFFALEINPTFVRKFKDNYPDTIIHLDSAANLQNYLKRHNLKHCDTIISSLPWTLLTREMQDKIFNAISASLSPKGKMFTYSYFHGLLFPSGRRFLKLLKQHFPHIQKKIVWRNIPPAIVYECKK